MLPTGSISKVYKYYFTTARFSNEVLRAMREFFDRPDLDQDAYLETDEKSEGFFNEWFLYDFVLANGKTVLADFITENPLKLSRNDMVLYQNLLKTNVYGLYEVVSIDIDVGLIIRNLQTGEETYVQERKLTSQVRPGSIFFGRVGRVGNHYELIGADGFSLDGLAEKGEKSLSKIDFKLTPKVAYDIWKMS